MPRMRYIKPEFWSDPVICSLDLMTRLLYIAMWNFADDEGRNRCISKEIVGFAFPLDDNIQREDVERCILQLSEAGRIVLYDVNGTRHYQVVAFAKHQVVNRPTPSRIPPPELYEPLNEELNESFSEPLTEQHGLGSRKLGSRNQEVRKEEVGGRMRVTLPPDAPASSASSFAQSAGCSPDTDHIAEAGEMVHDGVSGAEIEHILDERTERFPPTLEDVENWFVRRHGDGWRSEGTKFYYHHAKVLWRTGRNKSELRGWKEVTQLWINNAIRFLQEDELKATAEDKKAKAKASPGGLTSAEAQKLMEKQQASSVPPPAEFLALKNKIGKVGQSV